VGSGLLLSLIVLSRIVLSATLIRRIPAMLPVMLIFRMLLLVLMGPAAHKSMPLVQFVMVPFRI
jgi:hypothetical protein